jgi:hypothetical protein
LPRYDSVALAVASCQYPISELPEKVILALESACYPVPDLNNPLLADTCGTTEEEVALLAEDAGSKHVLFLKEVSPKLIFAQYRCKSFGKSFFPFQLTYYYIINQAGFVEKVIPGIITFSR